MGQQRSIATDRFRTIQQQMIDLLTLDELAGLAFNLDIDWESFPEGSKEQKTRALLNAVNQRRVVPKLITLLKADRPIVEWALDPDEDAAPPYRGLEFYREEDSELFFGRDALAAELVARLRDEPLLVIVGASGSGKSSLVRAGVIPALKGRRSLPEGASRPDNSADWAYLTLTPTERAMQPLDRLAEALTSDLVTAAEGAAIAGELGRDATLLPRHVHKYLSRVGRPRLLLLVDQAEEIFAAGVSPAGRQAFIDGLLAATYPASPMTLLLTLRADFYHRCAEHDGLRRAVSDHQTYIGAPSIAELREAIEAPARARGYALQDGMADLLLRDVGEEPGALPLLSHALRETWQRREGKTMTLAGYHGAGGALGAIARTAERLYAELDEGRQAVARRIFVELAELGEDALDTRRRVAVAALAAQGWYAGDGAAVLARLVEARLVTADQSAEGHETDGDTTVQIAHEALIRQWPRLREWLAADRERERQRREVERAATEWQRYGRDAGLLYRGARLAAARAWVEATTEVSPLVDEFVTAAAAAEAADRMREQALALARQQQRQMRARRLADEAVQRREEDPETALLLAAAAWQTTCLAGEAATDEARDALYRALNTPFRMALGGHDGRIGTVSFSPNGTRLVTAGADGTARLWDAARGRELAVLRGHEGEVTAAAFSPDGTRLATAGHDGTARLWDAASGGELAVLRGHKGKVWSAAFSPDGTRLVTASADRTARLWDMASGVELRETHWHKGEVWSAAFSPDGTRLVTAGQDGTARLWDATSGEVGSRRQVARLLGLAVLRGHEGGARFAAFSPDGTRLVTAGADGTARLWDAVSWRELVVLRGHEGEVWSAAFSPDGTRLATAGHDGIARVWDVASVGELVVLRGHEGEVTAAAFSPDVTRLVTAGEKAAHQVTAWLWDMTSGGELAVLRGHVGRIRSAAFSPDGTRLATGSDDERALLWDVASGGELAVLSGLYKGCWSVAFSPDGTRLVTASGFGTARLWDAASGDELASLREHEGQVSAAAFSPDGTRLVTAGADRTTRLWDAAGGRELAVLRGHEGEVTAAVFSPDGTRLVTASADRTARLWDAVSGGKLVVLRGHEGRVRSAAFSPDGTRLVTAGHDGTARLWDTANGDELAVLRGHEGEVITAAFSLDGTRVMTAGTDRTARVWVVPPAAQIGAVQRRLLREPTAVIPDLCARYYQDAPDECPRTLADLFPEG